MPTLQDVTLRHSQRLSELYRTRDVRIAEAQVLRDAQLRDLPAAAKAYQKYDDELMAAREKQIATGAKAEAARSSSLLIAIDRRGDRLEDAHLARRNADANAIATRRRAEDAASRKYEAAIAGLRDLQPRDRPKAAQEAERDRRAELDAARRAHDDALAVAQQQYRAAVDEALIDERRTGRDGERAYLDAVRLDETAAVGATAFADQALAEALSKIPEAREAMRAWREQLKVIAAETKLAEAEAFSRFRRDLDAIKS